MTAAETECPETWREAFLAVEIAHAGEPSIVLTPAELDQLRPVVAAARAAKVCLQCDPEIPEVWVPLPDWPHLDSSHGRLLTAAGIILKDRPLNRPIGDGPKYRKATLCIPGKPEARKTVTVHSVLLTGFEGERPDGCESCHVDDVPDHNHWGNLEWGPPDRNAAQKATQDRYRSEAAARRRSEHSRRSAATNQARRAAAAERDRAQARPHRQSPLRAAWATLTRHAPWRRRG